MIKPVYSIQHKYAIIKGLHVGVWIIGVTTMYEPGQAKCAFEAYADSKGPDLTAQMRSLIRAFAVCCQISFDIIECINGEQRSGYDLTHVQDDLNLHNLHMLQHTFSLDAAHMKTNVPVIHREEKLC